MLKIKQIFTTILMAMMITLVFTGQAAAQEPYGSGNHNPDDWKRYFQPDDWKGDFQGHDLNEQHNNQNNNWQDLSPKLELRNECWYGNNNWCIKGKEGPTPGLELRFDLGSNESRSHNQYGTQYADRSEYTNASRYRGHQDVNASQRRDVSRVLNR